MKQSRDTRFPVEFCAPHYYCHLRKSIIISSVQHKLIAYKIAECVSVCWTLIIEWKIPAANRGRFKKVFQLQYVTHEGVRVFPLLPPLFIRELTAWDSWNYRFSHILLKVFGVSRRRGRRRRREKSNTVVVDVLVLKWFGGHENTSTRVNRNFPINQFCNFIDNRKISSENLIDANLDHSIFAFDQLCAKRTLQNFNGFTWLEI